MMLLALVASAGGAAIIIIIMIHTGGYRYAPNHSPLVTHGSHGSASARAHGSWSTLGLAVEAADIVRSQHNTTHDMTWHDMMHGQRE